MQDLRFTGIVLALAAASVAVAQDDEGTGDQVWLNDGSHLLGELLELEDGKLTIDTRFAGVLKLDADEVAGISTTEVHQVAFEDGERVRGRLVYDADEQVQRVVDTTFGELEARTQIVALWDAEAPDPAERAAETAEEDLEQRMEQIETEHEERVDAMRAEHAEEIARLEEQRSALGTNWSARLELGLTGATGNTDRLGFRGRARALRETDYDRLSLHIGGDYTREGGEETSNQVFGGAGLEIDLDENLFTFVRAELERDEFEQLSLRSTVTGGLGYFLVREDDHELKVRGGAGFEHESFRDTTTNSAAVAELWLDYLVEIQPWLTLTHSLTLCTIGTERRSHRLHTPLASGFDRVELTTPLESVMTAMNSRAAKKVHRIFIVDDHPVVRDGLARMIGSESDLEICGQADGAMETMRQLSRVRPDLLIVDLHLEGLNGLELIKQVRARDGGVRILVISMQNEKLYAERVLRAGAEGFMSKREPPTKIIEVVRQVLGGRVYTSPEIADRMIHRAVRGGSLTEQSGIECLSDRELEVFERIGQGQSTREIAEGLRLSPKTIESYREQLKLKLGLKTGTELTHRAIHWQARGETG